MPQFVCMAQLSNDGLLSVWTTTEKRKACKIQNWTIQSCVADRLSCVVESTGRSSENTIQGPIYVSSTVVRRHECQSASTEPNLWVPQPTEQLSLSLVTKMATRQMLTTNLKLLTSEHNFSLSFSRYQLLYRSDSVGSFNILLQSLFGNRLCLSQVPRRQTAKQAQRINAF